ncbi:hypothetical protein ACNARK_12020 [Proteus sp. DFP240708]|uniref:hypothetical protein n=1 Tax=Proteus TaxID=583 RepID=UPI0018E40E0B|nr:MULTISPECIES: hypothetical protein [Proteus]MBI6216153.1 hypothetical protein [Proteus vulgaris]
MSDKDENCLTFVLKWSFIIILFTTVFLLGFSFIYYSQISLDSKISSFFSFLSSLGILATIGVYFWQKNDNAKKQQEFDEKLIPLIKKKSQVTLHTIKKIESLINKETKLNQLSLNKNKLILSTMTPSKHGINLLDFLNSVELNIHNDDDNEINNNKLKLSSDLYHYVRILNDEFNYIVNNLHSYITNNINNKRNTDSILSSYYNDILTQNKNDLLNSIEILETFIENKLKIM